MRRRHGKNVQNMIREIGFTDNKNLKGKDLNKSGAKNPASFFSHETNQNQNHRKKTKGILRVRLPNKKPGRDKGKPRRQNIPRYTNT